MNPRRCVIFSFVLLFGACFFAASAPAHAQLQIGDTDDIGVLPCLTRAIFEIGELPSTTIVKTSLGNYFLEPAAGSQLLAVMPKERTSVMWNVHGTSQLVNVHFFQKASEDEDAFLARADLSIDGWKTAYPSSAIAPEALPLPPEIPQAGTVTLSWCSAGQTITKTWVQKPNETEDDFDARVEKSLDKWQKKHPVDPPQTGMLLLLPCRDDMLQAA